MARVTTRAHLEQKSMLPLIQNVENDHFQCIYFVLSCINPFRTAGTKNAAEVDQGRHSGTITSCVEKN